MRLALVAMPWPLFNRPSIQLGSLKAFLNQHDWLTVETFHPYLAVARQLGTPVYHWISQHVWVCEALYAGLLFPEQAAASRRLLARELRKAPIDARFDPDQVRAILAEELDRLRGETDWRHFDLIGFSVCFNQLLASLAGAKILKAAAPDTPIVFGGSTCAPGVARSLLAAFPQLDYTVSGEGEEPLLALAAWLAGRAKELPPQITGRNRQHDAPATACPAGGQIKELDRLPLPDYDDYFRQTRALFADEPFIPELPVEFSRGCWWGKCTFCNLNLQWRGYRAKTAARMHAEVRALRDRYQTLDFTFTDNALPVRASVDFFDSLAQDDHDYRFFGEIRVSQRGEHLAACARGGLRSVQAGFEALSSSLLRRLDKGATTIDNLALMRDALTTGITADGNLIIEFPGSTEAEVAETLVNLDYALPFTPLSTAAFFLGLGSPVAATPRAYGIQAVTHHPTDGALFPTPVRPGLELLIKGYRGDRGQQRRRWAPVTRKVKEWQRFHAQRRTTAVEKPPLSYRDGGAFLIIRQELPAGRVLHHRLRGLSREIYLYCEEIRSLAELDERFPTVAGAKLRHFIKDLAAKRILFIEDERCLALAVRSK